MRAAISKRYSFDAAHQLPDHDGKCARPHGHTYGLRIQIVGEILDSPGDPKNGMVLDYGELDAIWKQSLEPRLDHRDLNLSLAGEAEPTSAENIAAFILRELVSRLPYGTEIEVGISETPKTEAIVHSRDLPSPG